ncbi:MAG: signal recognition particle-docking protein FtsY [Microthrixaceae bacterium]
MSSPLILIAIGIVLIAVAAAAVLLTHSDGKGEALDPPESRRVGTALKDRPVTSYPSDSASDDSSAGGLLVEDAPTDSPDLGVPDGDADGDLLERDRIDEEFERIIEEERPTFSGRLGRLRGVFSGYVGSILSRSSIDEETWEELEEAMLRADVGVNVTTELLESLRADVKKRGLTTPQELLDALKVEMKSRLAGPTELRFAAEKPTIWLFVGVNGVGKTTTIGKVGRRLTDDGLTVTMAAGDTFRAAAAEQLGTWAERCGADLVRGAEGGDPSSVIFDAVASAAASGKDVVLADTAGRLHTKGNLMEELAKVRRVADKGAGEVTEVLLVIDAVTGQNGLEQARKFAESTAVTGVVLTKLDGSAKGGVVLPIRSELDIPIKLVGLGESALQLVDFDADAFVEALFESVD